MLNPMRTFILTVLAMLAFAGNSLLCRMALALSRLDAATFTNVRLAAGALILALLVSVKGKAPINKGNWLSALALFVYAAGFSFAYLTLATGTGALLLFGAVQVTMIGLGILKGERLCTWQIAGFTLAFSGLVGLLLPGLSAPPLQGSLLMLLAGVAWGVYSLRGKSAGDPLQVTAGNFLRAALLSAVLLVFIPRDSAANIAGLGYAVASGALTSGLGYALWYSVLPALTAANAASVQLSVPVLAALGGVIFLGEPITPRLTLASAAVLGGIALVILKKKG